MMSSSPISSRHDLFQVHKTSSVTEVSQFCRWAGVKLPSHLRQDISCGQFKWPVTILWLTRPRKSTTGLLFTVHTDGQCNVWPYWTSSRSANMAQFLSGSVQSINQLFNLWKVQFKLLVCCCDVPAYTHTLHVYSHNPRGNNEA